MVDEHIKDCFKNNTAIEKSYKGNLNIRLSPELHKKAAYNASIRGISLNQYINDAIKNNLESSDQNFKSNYSNSFGTPQIILKGLSPLFRY